MFFKSTFSDNFHRANENPLNPSRWVNFPNIGSLAVVANECLAGQNTGFEWIGLEGPVQSFPADQYVEITLGPHINLSPAPHYFEADCIARAALDLSTGIDVFVFSNQDGTAGLFITELSGALNQSIISRFVPQPGDRLRLVTIGNQAYVFYNDVLLLQTAIVVAAGRPGLFMFSGNAVGLTPPPQNDTSVDYYEAGLASLTAFSQGAAVKLPFSRRTTAATAVFSCVQIASPQGARTLTSNVTVISELALAYAQLTNIYPVLIRQDTKNQQADLDAAITSALVTVGSLNGTIQSMEAFGDQAVVLSQMQMVVANALQSLQNASANPGE